jgi:SAM-dependent methyltransferase
MFAEGVTGYFEPGGVDDEPVNFALYGLARQEIWPDWVKMNYSLPILELGPGTKVTRSAERLEWPEYDFESPSNPRKAPEGAYRGKLPHEDNSVGGVVATHVLEHLYDARPIIAEVGRVLAPGCPFNIVVPHGDSLLFRQDIDHKCAYVLDTWKTLLENGYYDNTYGQLEMPKFVIGANFKFSIKEGNEIVVTQLVKQ